MAATTTKAPSRTRAHVDWAAWLLHRLGAPITQNNVDKLHAWEKAEGGLNVEHANNPFNTTLGSSAYPHVPGTSVPIYPSLDVGLMMTAKTIEEPQFGRIFYNLRHSGEKGRFVADVGGSPWGTKTETLAVALDTPPTVYDPNPATGAKGGGGTLFTPPPGNPPGQTGTFTAAQKLGISGFAGLIDLVTRLLRFIFSVRFVELVAGAILVFEGLVTLVRGTVAMPGRA